jgi:hypothetical protein
VTEELTAEWFLDLWDGRPGALLKKSRMLVLDNFKSHVTKEKTGTSNFVLYHILNSVWK